MAISDSGDYKAFMQRIGRRGYRSRAIGRAAVLLIPLLATGACNDDDGDDPFTEDAGAGGEHAAGAPGEPGEAGQPGAGGAEAGQGGAGPEGQAGAFAGPGPGELCIGATDCDDGLYCNGVERCIEKSPGSQARVCWSPEQGPCADRACDERAEACDCSNADDDSDGTSIEGCTPKGKPFDCDDTDARRSPIKTEVCDAADRDEDCNDQTYGQRDEDLDGFYDEACGNTSLFYGTRIGGTDCNDKDDSFNPRAKEVCDNADNDCDGRPDNVDALASEAPNRFYRDVDGDLYGDVDADPLLTLCSLPVGYSINNQDCNDASREINPAREEICNGLDDDCNGSADQPRAAGTLMFDEPYDGGNTQFVCEGEPGWAVSQCAPGRLNCGDESYLDGCETIGTTLCNCRACGNTCNFSCGETGCEEIVSVSTGAFHTCALVAPPPAQGAEARGSVACWGENLDGQLGNGTYRNSPVARGTVELTNVKAIASGVTHTCAIAGEADRVLCWGDNTFGQLGSPEASGDSPYPLPVAVSGGYLRAVAQVAAGAQHTCALHSGGRVSCWGQGELGRIGDDDIEEHIGPSPAQVRRLVGDAIAPVTDAVALAIGGSHSCLINGAGGVECWGDNSSGQLGQDPVSMAASGTPVLVAGIEAVDEVALGPTHTCARSGGSVYCWGDNSQAELGYVGAASFRPVLVQAATGARALVAGAWFSCALDLRGDLYCWGSNQRGEGGCSADSTQTLWRGAGNSVFAGHGQHFCVQRAAGHIECLGNNGAGQLGDGATSLLPQCVPRQPVALGGARGCVAPD